MCEDPTGFQAFVDLCLPAGDDVTLSEADVYRLYCHLLLQHIPTEGLKETAESLDEMCNFYSAPNTPQKGLAPSTLAVPARAGQVFVRPVFPITDEE